MLNQIEIPTWFDHQNRGSYVSIPLHKYDTNWTGIALYVDIKVQKNLSEVSPGDPTEFHEFRLEMHGGPEDFHETISSLETKFMLAHLEFGYIFHMRS